jgi:hypothetical protein
VGPSFVSTHSKSCAHLEEEQKSPRKWAPLQSLAKGIKGTSGLVVVSAASLTREAESDRERERERKGKGMMSTSHAAPAAGPSGTTGGMGSGGSNVSEVELMRTILGEHVPQSVILTCLNACNFDVTAALNWYFMEVASHEAEQERSRAPSASSVRPLSASASGATAMDIGQQQPHSAVPIIQSGLALTLHSRNVLGMMSKTDTYYATLTRGVATYDMITPSNEKFLAIKLRKRHWRPPVGGTLFSRGAAHPGSVQSLQHPFLMNGDIVTLECNGLWLKTSSLHKMLQWKSPSDDDRCKFVIRGLPLGRNLRPGDYFFLTSYKFEDKEIVMKEEKPVGVTSYNTSVHRCFLGLDRIKWYCSVPPLVQIALA